MCPHEEKLTAWLLGDLSPEEHEALTRHLETCDSCRSVKEELARVLTPLRSGLAKDRNLRFAPQAVQTLSRSTFRTLWSTPHEGLKRVAILALSFGTLFVFISVVYQNAQPQRTPHDPDAVTYISFLQTKEEPPPPLAPVADVKSEADKDVLSEAIPRSEKIALPPESITLPAVPAPEPQTHSFRRLVKADAEPEEKQKTMSDAAPAAAAAPELPAPAKSVAKRERAKAAGGAPQRPPAGLMTKPVRLAGVASAATLAPTNAVPTNAVPTNAVMPTLKTKP